MRFTLIYNIGEDLELRELTDKLSGKDKMEFDNIRIIDTTGELEDLYITDNRVGQSYVDYFNNNRYEKEIKDLIRNIESNLSRLNDLNRGLIKPEKEVIGYDDECDVPVYEMPLKEELYYLGYNTRVNHYSHRILEDLNNIKNILFNEED